jgi:enamine deaminase RidA (YjgF/YER057c/UK114 family)
MRRLYSSGAKWESIVGYSRAVRVDNIIEVSGTTAMRNGELVGHGDVGAQTECILSIIQEAIEGLGGTINDVVRTRVYVTDISQWQAVGEAHAKYFKDIRPASAMVEVSKLINDDMLVEIEATAVLPSHF